MAITLSCIEEEHKVLPPRIILYGPPGIGKTTWSTSAPSPVVIRTEDGLGLIKVPAFPLATKLLDVVEALHSLTHEEHGFKSVVIDSLDWLEPLIWKEVAEKAGKKSIEDIGFNKGYKEAVDLWRYYIYLLDVLREKKRMFIIQTAHSVVRRFDAPDVNPYDRYELKMHPLASALLTEWAEAVLFVNYQVVSVATGKGFNETQQGRGDGKRILYAEQRPAFLAKNRIGLKSELPFSWESIGGGK